MTLSSGWQSTARAHATAIGDTELFIASVEDPGRAERLAIAIKGRGAFRRFEDEIARWPGELDRWHALSEERQRAELDHGSTRPATARCPPTTTPGQARHPASLLP